MTVAKDVAGAPLGVVATVTDFNGGPYEGRTVRWTVKRGGTTLYTGHGETGADGTVAVTGDTLGVPAGPLTVVLELLRLHRRAHRRPKPRPSTRQRQRAGPHAPTRPS